MDLPKELLQKHLPKKRRNGEKTPPTSTAQGGETSRLHGIQSQSGARSHPEGHMPEADDEGALFVEAMQGMVHQSRKRKKSAHHGSFPLPMPTITDESPNDQAIIYENTASVSSCAQAVPDDASLSAPCTASEAVRGKGLGRDSGKIAPSPACPAPSMPSDSDEAFALAMRTVQPLKGKGREIPPPVVTVDADAAQSLALHALLDSEIVFDVHLSGENVQGQVVGLDPKVLTSLMSGSQSPEARLDLHGMNAAQAFQALVPFFKSAWHKGLRTVIVVTGRGINSPTGMAVLRQKVSSWLTQEPFRRVVLAFSTAQPCDGGTGGMYVLLRKFRKKHPVYWERTPIDPDVF